MDLKKNIFILSGLGVDERVFQWMDLSEFNTTFIKWTTPESGMSIENYSKQLLSQINTDRPILIGLSFGGIIAIEISKLIAVEKVIIISSVKGRHEIPWYLRFAGKLRLHKLPPNTFLNHSTKITNWFFGTSSEKENQLLKQILLESDPDFLRWGIDKILNWTNVGTTARVIHIHGTADRLFLYKNIHCDIPIADGGHFMILNKSAEVLQVLKNII